MLTKRLKMLREEAGYTQRALSERLNLSDARYNQYETGKRSPDFEILTEIANFYGVTTDYLLSVSDIRNPYEPIPSQHIRMAPSGPMKS